MPDPTAHLDKVTSLGEATTPATIFVRGDFTRFEDRSEDYFVSEVNNDATAEAILTAMEADCGETFD